MRRKGASGTTIVSFFRRGGSGMWVVAVDFALQPGAGEDPVTIRGAGRDAKDFGRLLAGQAGEIAQLDESGLFGMPLREFLQSCVESQEPFFGHWSGEVRHAEIEALARAAVLDALFAASVLDENTAHSKCGGAKEVAPAFPALPVAAEQAHISLVDQCRRLERLAGRFLSQPLCRQPAQFLVDEREQFIGCVQIALVQGVKDAGDFTHRRLAGD
jgi:hypothetical protein